MSDLHRRDFLAAVATAVPAAALAGCAERPKPRDTGTAAYLDPRLLRALARAILPSELGSEGIERVAASFERWVEDYRPRAELNHGYGTGAEEVQFAAEHPGPGWGAQLKALDLAARERLGRPWLALEPGNAREVVRAQLMADRTDRLPAPGAVPNVAVGLLAFFYDSPEATDLCYLVQIGRTGCRPLAESPERPRAQGTAGAGS